MGQGDNSKRERSNDLYALQALNRIVDAIAGAGLPPSPTGISTEQTLSDFATANDDTLNDILTALQTGLASAANQQTLISAFNAFANQNNIDIVDVKDAIETFDSQNGTDLGNILAQLQAFDATNNAALQNVETAIQTFDAQNGTDLAAILTALQNGDQLANIRSNTAKDGSGTALYPLLDADGHLQVDILSGGGGGDASAANQLIEITKLTSIEGTQASIEGYLTSIDQKTTKVDTDDVTVTSSALPTGASTEANQSAMITELQQIEAELVGGIDVSMAATTVTPNLVRSTGVGTIPSGARSFSIANVGAADADILGGANNLKTGEIVNFDAGLNNTYGAVAYDATGTELLITYNS